MGNCRSRNRATDPLTNVVPSGDRSRSGGSHQIDNYGGDDIIEALLSGGALAASGNSHHNGLIIMMNGPNNNFAVSRANAGRHGEFEDILTRLLLHNFMFSSVRLNRAMHQNVTPFADSASHSGMTDEDIDNLQKFTVDESTNLSTLGDCGITLDSFKIGDDVIALPCGHCYKADAVRGWLKDHVTCPICRDKITNTGET